MTGKVFAQSENVYQDQAKLLFDYYMRSAQKIVQEEERIEKEIADLEKQKKRIEEEIAKIWWWPYTIVLFIFYYFKKKGLQKQIDDIEPRIREFKKQHDEIFRDYKITKMGVVYTPIANQVKYEDESFIVDYTGSVPESAERPPGGDDSRFGETVG